MEVIKCGLCKEEIEYAQRCRVYIKTDESRPYQRISKRPHLGRYKLISTAKSTEHISFARRLKRLKTIKNNKKTSSNNSPYSKQIDQKAQPPLKKKGTLEESKSREEPEPKEDPIIPKTVEETHAEGETLNNKQSELFRKTDKDSSEKESPSLEDKAIGDEIADPSVSDIEDFEVSKKYTVEIKPVGEVFGTSKEIVKKSNLSKKKSPIRKCTKNTTAENSKNLSSVRIKMNHPHFQSSFEEYIKPSLSKNNAAPNPNEATTESCLDSSSELDENKHLQLTSTPKSSLGRHASSLRNSDCETYYWLEMPKPKQPEPRRLGYDFQNLVTEVKHMKLPNSDWKIKIMVHKQQMISVSFTKKLFPEKVVSVNAKSLICDISIDGKKIILKGSPPYIYSIKDVEIMLNIVDDIEPNSPMITYLKSFS